MCAASSGVGGGSDPVQSVLDAKQASLRSQIDITVTAKALQSEKSQGEAIVALIQSNVPQGKAIGAGTHFDSQG